MNALRRWMDKATPAQKKRLAREARTTLGTLYQIAGSYRTDGVPRVEADLAGRIARATGYVIRREELSPACAKCEYAKRCKA